MGNGFSLRREKSSTHLTLFMKHPHEGGKQTTSLLCEQNGSRARVKLLEHNACVQSPLTARVRPAAQRTSLSASIVFQIGQLKACFDPANLLYSHHAGEEHPDQHVFQIKKTGIIGLPTAPSWHRTSQRSVQSGGESRSSKMLRLSGGRKRLLSKSRFLRRLPRLSLPW